jgi:HAD superfamily hydrolase (TIGR01549 family)
LSPNRQQIPLRPRALLFDMDGTITAPTLDFPQIRAAMGIAGKAVLEALAEMEESRRRKAEAILHGFEERAARDSTLNTGCDALVEWARISNIKTAIITRNTRHSVASVLQKHGLTFDVLITREDGKFKPDPHPLRIACEKLNVSADDAWMVGDGSYDVAAGNAAGVRTIWISHGRPREFNDVPWQTVTDLPRLLTLLCSCRP